MKRAISGGAVGAQLRQLLHHPFKLLLFAVISNGIYALLFMAIEQRGLEESLWWGWVTAFTVGYGDIAPVSLPGRGVAVLNMATNLLVLQFLSARIIAMVFVEDVLDPKEQAVLLFRAEENARMQCATATALRRLEEHLGTLPADTPSLPVFRTNEELAKHLGF